jgi:hypothetical protein
MRALDSILEGAEDAKVFWFFFSKKNILSYFGVGASPASPKRDAGYVR